mmetsp:Transcript_33162/g.79376  ORF Transcript_33162/g.79376 Transcript_33162/m.79376 type:complete len:283 (+) Transcript_33162:751-1599(+)
MPRVRNQNVQRFLALVEVLGLEVAEAFPQEDHVREELAAFDPPNHPPPKQDVVELRAESLLQELGASLSGQVHHAVDEAGKGQGHIGRINAFPNLVRVRQGRLRHRAEDLRDSARGCFQSIVSRLPDVLTGLVRVNLHMRHVPHHQLLNHAGDGFLPVRIHNRHGVSADCEPIWISLDDGPDLLRVRRRVEVLADLLKGGVVVLPRKEVVGNLLEGSLLCCDPPSPPHWTTSTLLGARQGTLLLQHLCVFCFYREVALRWDAVRAGQCGRRSLCALQCGCRR